MPYAVIPAKAGIHFDFALYAQEQDGSQLSLGRRAKSGFRLSPE
jgi:hypothetical protein